MYTLNPKNAFVKPQSSQGTEIKTLRSGFPLKNCGNDPVSSTGQAKADITYAVFNNCGFLVKTNLFMWNFFYSCLFVLIRG